MKNQVMAHGVERLVLANIHTIAQLVASSTTLH